MKYLFALAAAAGFASADYIRCATSNPTAKHMAMLDAAATNYTHEFSIQATRNINTFVHIVVANSGQRANYPQSMINEQVRLEQSQT